MFVRNGKRGASDTNFTALAHLVNTSPIINEVIVKYVFKGHTAMSTDFYHAAI